MNEVLNPLTRRQRIALLMLAQELGFTHERNGIHRGDGERYFPTPKGWQPVVRFNWRENYRELERNYENLQSIVRMQKKDIQEMKKLLRIQDNGMMKKVWDVLQSHVDNTEKVKMLQRYIQDKINKKNEGD